MCCTLANAPVLNQCLLQISKYVEREILNHKRLNQPHIIELREVGAQRPGCCALSMPLLSSSMPAEIPCIIQVFLTPEYLAIAMEYAAGGDMFQLVVRQRGLPESDARWYFQQLIIAIDYCHRMVCYCPLHFAAFISLDTFDCIYSLARQSLSILTMHRAVVVEQHG